MRDARSGYRAVIRKLALVGGMATLMTLTLGTSAGQAGAATVAPVTSTHSISANGPAASVHGSTPAPAPNPNPTVTNPGPLPLGAPQPGIAPSSGGSLLDRALLASGRATPASSLPAAGPCALAGKVWTCDDLWAIPGTLTLPGPISLPIWGFAPGTSSAPTGPATVPGPIFTVTAGFDVQIIIHNGLPNPASGSNMLSLEVPASSVVPDLTGIAPGSSHTYDFGTFAPGTYIYEAGATGYGARQVKMGLAGIMIVRPTNFLACNCAYGSAAGDGFVDESALLLNEFDPLFNADPFLSDPIDFSPTLFTINGQAYDPGNPGLSQINVGSGDVLLLHEANLSEHERGVTIVNERQSILADDSNALKNPTNVATKWLNPGQVSDSFVTVDPSFPLGTRVPIYDAGLHFNNGSSSGLGGMFAYLDVTVGLAGTPNGPVTSVAVSPQTNSGSEDLAVSGNITATLPATVTAAEWFLDDPGVPGTGTPFSVSGSLFSFAIPSATLNTLLLSSIKRDGDHILWAHGQDSNGNWGVVSGDVFTYNVTGPVIGELTVHVSPTNGSRPTDVVNGGGPVVNVNICLNQNTTCTPTPIAQNAPNNDLVILGMAGASLSNFVVTGAEYCLDANPCASPTPIVLTPSGSDGTNQIDAYGNVLTTPTACVPVATPAGVTPPSLQAAPGGGSVVSFCGIVPAATLLLLTQGTHNLYIHACEQVSSSTGACNAQIPSRWGAFSVQSSIQFVIDRTGPKATGLSLDPNPNNGHLVNSGNLNFLDSIQVAATIDDSTTGNSNIGYAEVFVTAPTGQLGCNLLYPAVLCPIDPITHAVPPDGTGAQMIALGGAWTSPAQVGYAYVPLAELTAYPEGHVRFWVHGQDLAGNFGPWSYVDLTYDTTPPVFDTPALPVPPAPPTSVACTSGCAISMTAHDPVSGGVNSNIVQGEWFIDQGAHLICELNAPGCTPEVVALSDPGYGNGTPISIPSPGTSISASFNPGPLPVGTRIVFRVKDAAGNWSLDNLVVTS